MDKGEASEDLSSAAEVEVRSNWLRTPSPIQDSWFGSTQEVMPDFPVTDSVESVGFSEGTTDAEESIEIEGELDTEHVVKFTSF